MKQKRLKYALLLSVCMLMPCAFLHARAEEEIIEQEDEEVYEPELITEEIEEEAEPADEPEITEENDYVFEADDIETAKQQYEIRTLDCEHGRIKVLPASRFTGRNVVHAFPDEGYVTVNIRIEDDEGNDVKYSDIGTDMADFELNCNVSVSAQFEKKDAIVSYVDENGTGYTRYDAIPLSSIYHYLIIDDLYSGWYYLDDNFDITLVTSVLGNANLILTDGHTLFFKDGLQVNPGASLTIWPQAEGTGKLIASHKDDGFYNCAGIGGSDRKSNGTITIHGGIVEAYGDAHSAGIGGGRYAEGSEIAIYGGNVTAYAGAEGAAIGGGMEGNGGKINIFGGTVRAYGNDCGAAIGGGQYGTGGEINISGGDVYAEADCYKLWDPFSAAGAGIGGGEDRDGGVIRISGGHVVAKGGNGYLGNGAGIGGGAMKVPAVLSRSAAVM